MYKYDCCERRRVGILTGDQHIIIHMTSFSNSRVGHSPPAPSLWWPWRPCRAAYSPYWIGYSIYLRRHSMGKSQTYLIISITQFVDVRVISETQSQTVRPSMTAQSQSLRLRSRSWRSKTNLAWRDWREWRHVRTQKRTLNGLYAQPAQAQSQRTASLFSNQQYRSESAFTTKMLNWSVCDVDGRRKIQQKKIAFPFGP